MMFWVTALFVSPLCAIPCKIMTYAKPTFPYQAIYIAYDYEGQKMLNSFYSVDEPTNLVSIISNTFVNPTFHVRMKNPRISWGFA